jgi:predicted enzyme related to lactoylglutathione lyase
MKPAALLGLRTVVYEVTDLPRARAWYAALLGIEPYFEQPYYVGYDIDGAELGLDPDTSQRKPGPGGAIAYWKVDDLYSSWEFSMMNGADPLEPPHNVGKGTDVAIVADPFGNYIGLIQIES